MRLIDLSQLIESGMVTYPGLLTPTVSDWLTRDTSRERYHGLSEFQIGRIDMIGNTGTYIDTAFHRDAGGGDIADLALERIANVPGVLVDIGDLDHALESIDMKGRAVLIRTGWSQHWRTEKYGDDDHPFVTRDQAKRFVRKGAALVGIDCINIDNARDFARPAHTVLLRAGIPIVEHLTNLEALRDATFTFFAVPARVRGMASFPVRAFAIAE